MGHILELCKRYPQLAPIQESIREVYSILESTFASGHKLLVAGNGGSASDSEHIVGELMKRFHFPRLLSHEFTSSLAALKQTSTLDSEYFDYVHHYLHGAIPAIALTNHNALSSACINDEDGNVIFAQQLYGWGVEGDVFMGISTSGNAKNVIYAAITAKAKGLKVVSLSGATGGKLAKLADASINVPEHETYKIQELHLPVYHTLCMMLEERFFT
ncbi:MAG: SIS domain-containing protein [Spirochaetaceae bacterium]|jgi:D-sedoheptulose 7-phosphate isomerase|nr:SIS domain-containing protein [Spirochaetaceae bacterium]